MKHVFVDTWGWITLADKNDPNFPEVSELYRNLSRRKTIIVTSEWVLQETGTLLFSRFPFTQSEKFFSSLLEAGEKELLSIMHINREDFYPIYSLRKKYRDKPQISFVDLSTIWLISELKIKAIITDDEHFHKIGLDLRILPFGQKS